MYLVVSIDWACPVNITNMADTSKLYGARVRLVEYVHRFWHWDLVKYHVNTESTSVSFKYTISYFRIVTRMKLVRQTNS